LNTSDLEDDTICILTTLNVIKMPAYCCIFWQMLSDYESQNPEHLAVWEEKYSAVKM